MCGCMGEGEGPRPNLLRNATMFLPLLIAFDFAIMRG